MTRKRRLRPEEQELWQQVARSAEPLRNRDLPHPDAPADPRPPERADAAPAKPAAPLPLSRFALGENAPPRAETHYFPKRSCDRLFDDPVRMDAKAFTRLKRGKLDPEARLDLHGMTLDRAHGALSRFVLMSQSRGHRLVLVITGKGAVEDPYDPLPRPRGALKRQVPLWLKQPPVAQAVLQIAPAHIRHGGEGALYVYLRRPR